MSEHKRLRVEVPLRWRDLDAFQHVNNATMFTLLEEARVRLLFRSEEQPKLPTAILNPALDTDTLMLIASHRIEYLAPVAYQPGPIEVQMWFARIGGASADMCYEVRTSAGGQVAVQAMSTFVLVNPPTGQSRKLSDDERAAWEPFIDEPVKFRR